MQGHVITNKPMTIEFIPKGNRMCITMLYTARFIIDHHFRSVIACDRSCPFFSAMRGSGQRVEGERGIESDTFLARHDESRFTRRRGII